MLLVQPLPSRHHSTAHPMEAKLVARCTQPTKLSHLAPLTCCVSSNAAGPMLHLQTCKTPPSFVFDAPSSLPVHHTTALLHVPTPQYVPPNSSKHATFVLQGAPYLSYLSTSSYHTTASHILHHVPTNSSSPSHLHHQLSITEISTSSQRSKFSNFPNSFPLCIDTASITTISTTVSLYQLEFRFL